MPASVHPFKYIRGQLTVGARGQRDSCPNVEAGRENRRVPNELGSLLGNDYRMIRHHLNVLTKNKMIASAGNGCGMTYLSTSTMK
jgi:hypothetical protein